MAPRRPSTSRRPAALCALQATKWPESLESTAPRIGWTGASAPLVALLSAAVALSAGDAMLSGRTNGSVLCLLKCVHSINHYWHQSAYISSSLAGCLVLTFSSGTLTAAALDEPADVLNPEKIGLFLLAFAFVRSDSLETCAFRSKFMHRWPVAAGLNLCAALYKLRKMAALVELAPKLGAPAVLLVGTTAFSACNCLMALEGRALHAARAAVDGPRYPRFGATLRRHATVLAALLAGQQAGATASAVARLAVLAYLFNHYNKNLFTAPPVTPPAACARRQHVGSARGWWAEAPSAAALGRLMAMLLATGRVGASACQVAVGR